MITAAIVVMAVCLVSLGAGFTARRLAARPPAARGAPGVTASGRWTHLAAALLRPDGVLVAMAAWLALLDVTLGLAAPWPLKFVIDYALGRHPYPQTLTWMNGLHPTAVAAVAAAAGLLLLLAAAVAGYLVTVLTAAISERMTVRLRVSLIGHVLSAEPRRIAAYPLGELTSRLGGDAVRLAATVTALVDTLVPDVALLTGMTVVTAVLDWRLTLIAAGIIPLYAATARTRNRALRGVQRTARARSGQLAALSADLLARLPAVHVFDRDSDEASRYQQASADAALAEVTAVDAGARFAPVTDTLPGLALAAALVTGTVEVTAGRLTLGGLLVFLAYLSSLTAPVRSLARLSATIARGTASRDRVVELLCLPPLEPALATLDRVREAPRRIRRERGPAIRLDRVSYAYRTGHPVLDKATLDVPPGTLLCVTGESGSGKSTLLSLLVRLADPQSGMITVDGRDITGFPLSQLRALVTLVPQDPWLHSGTIADNIAYGRRGATRAEILAAAAHAGVAAFADDLPDGYETPTGEHGHQLSGGQRRRVAVARALIRDAPVLLLDEPTTGLDPAAEASLIASLTAATRDKTVILVSHQPKLIASADHIVRLEAGHLTGTGPWITPSLPRTFEQRPGSTPAPSMAGASPTLADLPFGRRM
jgi:ABC-type multidrug transport system fused ATPase/permease subunit